MGERSRRVLRGIRSPLDSGSIIGRTSPGRGPAEQLSVAEVLGFIGSVGDVTLAGSFDYLTLSGQEITLNPIDLDTDISGTLAIASGGTGAQNATDARTNLGLGSAAVEDIGTSGANIGLLSANVTHSGSFSVTGAFRSIGIDDNSTVEVFELEDDNATLGGSGITDFTFMRNINSKLLGLSGGNSATSGFNFLLHGGTHSTLANDLIGRSGSTTIFEWNDSASLFSFLTGNVLVSNDLSVAGAFTSLGIDDNATGSRLTITDGQFRAGANAQYNMVHFNNDQSFLFSGGSGGADGANILLNGGIISGVANDIRIRADTITHLYYDHSATLWNFQNSDVTMDQALTVVGAFTSKGINDDASGERLKVVDGALVIGPSSGSYAIRQAIDTESFTLSGGDANNVGANIIMFAGTHATRANDLLYRASGTVILSYDHSITRWLFDNSDVRMTGSLAVLGFFSVNSAVELTISGGVVTATGSHHKIDTEADAATDDLDTINGGSEGDILYVRSTNAARDPTFKDGTGNLQLVGDFVATDINQTLVLQKFGANWVELSRAQP